MSNSQWHSDQAEGERATRAHELQQKRDARLGNALWKSGITVADVLAARLQYEAVEHPRILIIRSALQAVEEWLRDQEDAADGCGARDT